MREFIYARNNGYFSDKGADYHLFTYEVGRSLKDFARRIIAKTLGVKGDEGWTPTGWTSLNTAHFGGSLMWTFDWSKKVCIVTDINSHWAYSERKVVETMSFLEAYKRLHLGHLFQSILSEEVDWS